MTVVTETMCVDLLLKAVSVKTAKQKARPHSEIYTSLAKNRGEAKGFREPGR